MTSLDRIKKTISNFLKLGKKKGVGYRVFLLLVFILLLGLTINGFKMKRVDIKIGEVSDKNIRAPRDIVDLESTESLKLQAKDNITPKYRIDTSVQIALKRNIKQYFELLYETKEDQEDSNLKKLEEQSYININFEDSERLLSFEEDKLSNLESNIYEVINQSLGSGVEKENLIYEKNNIDGIFSNLTDLDLELQRIGSSIVKNNLKENKFLDVEATNKAKEEAEKNIKPVIIREGSIIVGKNEVVTEKDYNILRENNLIKTDNIFDIRLIIGSIFIVSSISLVFGVYMYYFENNIFNNRKMMTLIVLIGIITIFISKIFSEISGYLMPVAIASITLSLLISTRIALLINIVISLFLLMTTGVDTDIIVMTTLGGIIGTFSKTNSQQRSNMIITGGLISLLNIVFILSFVFIYDIKIDILIEKIIYAGLGGILSGILSLGLIPIWENVFGILTPGKLLELISPNQNLLKELLTKAPGTYYHSILVGNLAENAASRIGADSLLTRAGAYYHDIGKMKRAYFFKENQTGENPHDKLDPKFSFKIITNHVTDGEKIAEENKLPKLVKSMIVEHHGTSLVKFFLYKQLELEGKKLNEVDKNYIDKFRYKGKKPQSKETAILMIADSIEAATRVEKGKNKEETRKIIKKIIDGKIEEGQLDESPLTLSDLKEIEESFLDTILAIYHERIEYPDFKSL